ncbi:ankyrin repeat domain-containing protein [Wolbachia endosymbiont (group A) of Machimus atricapillus]|uniref:ankyrin repeat domain-containing protein n=1 Tax=Wolbachia endosymbiont (group A) of Machimus atricapillus TaxID=3066147 RepID=UPI003132C2BD
MSISKASPSLKHSIAAISLYVSSIVAGVSTYFVYLAISNATIRLIHFIAIASGVVALSLVVYFINSAVSEESGKIQIDSKLTKSIAVFLLCLSSFVAGIYTYPVVLLISNSAVIPVLSAVVASISTITALISAQFLLKSTAYRANDEKQECMSNTHNEKPNDNNVSTKIPEGGPTMLGIGVYQAVPASLPKSSNLLPPNSPAPTNPVSTLPNSSAPTNPVSTLPNSSAPTNPVSTLPNSPAPTNPVSTLPNSPAPTNPVSTLPNSPAPTNPVSTLPNSPAPTNPVSTLPNSSAPTNPVSTLLNFHVPPPPPPPLPQNLLGSNYDLPSRNLNTPDFSPAGPAAKLSSSRSFIEEIKAGNLRLRKLKGNKRNRADTLQAAQSPKGVNVNITNKYGSTALHNAAYYGNLRIIKFLLEKDANSNIINGDEKTRNVVAVLRHNKDKPYDQIIKLIAEAEDRYESTKN